MTAYHYCFFLKKWMHYCGCAVQGVTRIIDRIRNNKKYRLAWLEGFIFQLRQTVSNSISVEQWLVSFLSRMSKSGWTNLNKTSRVGLATFSRRWSFGQNLDLCWFRKVRQKNCCRNKWLVYFEPVAQNCRVTCLCSSLPFFKVKSDKYFCQRRAQTKCLLFCNSSLCLAFSPLSLSHSLSQLHSFFPTYSEDYSQLYLSLYLFYAMFLP